MLPRERVFTTLDHREPDRIPWGEHLIDYNIYEAILGRPSLVNSHFYQQKALWEGRLDEVMAHYKRDLPDLAEALELDIVTLPRPFPAEDDMPEPMEQLDEDTYRDADGNVFKVARSCWLLPYERNREAYVAPTVESVLAEIDELEAQPELDITGPEWEVHRYIVDKMKATHFIAALGGGLEFPRFGCTWTEAWMNLLDHPDVCMKLNELRCKRSLRLFRAYAALGLDGVIPCGDLGNSQGLSASPEIYGEMVYPFQKMQVDEGHRLGLKVLLHCCGHTMPVLDDIADLYDAYESIQIGAGMDMRVVKERVGDRITLWSGIMHEHLNGGTVEDIRADARYAFRYAAPGGGYIMGSSHSLAVGAKIENVLEMKRVRNEWGNYPIDLRLFNG